MNRRRPRTYYRQSDIQGSRGQAARRQWRRPAAPIRISTTPGDHKRRTKSRDCLSPSRGGEIHAWYSGSAEGSGAQGLKSASPGRPTRRCTARSRPRVSRVVIQRRRRSVNAQHQVAALATSDRRHGGVNTLNIDVPALATASPDAFNSAFSVGGRRIVSQAAPSPLAGVAVTKLAFAGGPLGSLKMYVLWSYQASRESGIKLEGDGRHCMLTPSGSGGVDPLDKKAFCRVMSRIRSTLAHQAWPFR